MNEYKITYVADEGETEQAYIIERTEAAARRLFRRTSGSREIVGVELYSIAANATKEQEREALEKIKAMVAELGPNSYLATAFDGVFDDAEQNIEFDAAFSMKSRAEHEAHMVKELESKLSASQSDVEILRSQLEHAEAKARSTDVGVEGLIQKDEERKEVLLQMSKALDEARSATGDAQRRAEEAEAQVVQLKAKLYDYMTATA